MECIGGGREDRLQSCHSSLWSAGMVRLEQGRARTDSICDEEARWAGDNDEWGAHFQVVALCQPRGSSGLLCLRSWVPENPQLGRGGGGLNNHPAACQPTECVWEGQDTGGNWYLEGKNMHLPCDVQKIPTQKGRGPQKCHPAVCQPPECMWGGGGRILS